MRFGLVAALLGWLAPAPAGAQTVHVCDGADPARVFFDPCPGADSQEIALPMPLGLAMVMRAVEVPGADFWYDERRMVRLGNPDSPMYEAVRLVSMAGTFPSPSGDGWLIYLGKYEVSVAQYLAVMGDGDLAVGVRELVERSKTRPDGAPLDEYALLERGLGTRAAQGVLASPVRGLSHEDYREFMLRFTKWCYRDAACYEKLPKLDDFPAFLRFPTEEEWEYTARGGFDPNADPPFDWTNALPFEPGNAEIYARIAPSSDRRSTVIGRYRDVGGFYDLFGNVREIAEGRFTTEPGQGRVGGFTLRGGSFLTTANELHSGRREELPLYRVTDQQSPNGVPVIQESRPTDVGMRVALGAPVAASIAFEKEIGQAYASYRQGSRFDSGVQRAGAPGLTRAAHQLRFARALAERLRPGANEIADQLTREFNTIEHILDEEAFKVAVGLVERAVIVAAEAGRTQNSIRRAQGFLDVTRDTSSDQARASRARADQRVAEEQRQLSERMAQYVEKIFEIASYSAFGTEALTQIATRLDKTPIDQAAITVVDRHTRELLNGNEDVDRWRRELRDAFPESVFTR
jgi:hypothetical protein